MYSIIAAMIILFTIFLIISNSGAELCCGEFEEESNCTNTCTEKKCIPSKEPQFCPLYCMQGCVCKKGYVRISNNVAQCIPECLCPFLAPFIEEQTSCYPCDKYSRYTTCGSSCPETCNPSEYDAVRCSADQSLVGYACNPGFVKISKNIDICIPKYLCRFLLPYTA